MSKLMELVDELSISQIDAGVFYDDKERRKGFLKDAGEIRDKIQAIADSMEWISVKDKEPPHNVMVLCHTGAGYSVLRKDSFMWWEGRAEFAFEVYHWMPLPNPPKESKDE